MAKRRWKVTPESIQKRIALGRGQKEGKDYMPWLTIQDVPSLGLVHRIKGSKHGRVHHLMSNLERDYFYLLDWSEDVVDIREQYPLLPLEETMKIAELCGVKHPQDPATRNMIVMTTDFLITMAKDGRRWLQARTVKPSQKLNSRRVLEKFEIERKYWEARNISWGIVTERDMPSIVVRNIDVLRLYRTIDDRGLSRVKIQAIIDYLRCNLREALSPLARITCACDAAIGVRPGSSLVVAYHMIATRQWEIDLHQPFNPTEIFILRERKDSHVPLPQ